MYLWMGRTRLVYLVRCSVEIEQDFQTCKGRGLGLADLVTPRLVYMPSLALYEQWSDLITLMS